MSARSSPLQPRQGSPLNRVISGIQLRAAWRGSQCEMLASCRGDLGDKEGTAFSADFFFPCLLHLCCLFCGRNRKGHSPHSSRPTFHLFPRLCRNPCLLSSGSLPSVLVSFPTSLLPFTHNSWRTCPVAGMPADERETQGPLCYCHGMAHCWLSPCSESR